MPDVIPNRIPSEQTFAAADFDIGQGGPPALMAGLRPEVD
jgi:hypothetical protein